MKCQESIFTLEYKVLGVSFRRRTVKHGFPSAATMCNLVSPSCLIPNNRSLRAIVLMDHLHSLYQYLCAYNE